MQILNEIVNNDTLWQMSFAEKMAMYYLIDRMPDRKVAIEIGSYCGGFLKVLSKYFEHVYSLDLSHGRLDKSQFNNVTWLEGDSKVILPELLSKVDTDFILVDGDHEYNGVLHDLNNIMNHVPRKEILLAIHDTWYPAVRLAIDNTAWNQYTHYIEKDLVTGDIMHNGSENIPVGGLGIAILKPTPFEEQLLIHQTYNYMYCEMMKCLKSQSADR